MAAKAASMAIPTPTSAPTPVGNPFEEETDVFAQASPAVLAPSSPARKPAVACVPHRNHTSPQNRHFVLTLIDPSMHPHSPALVVSPVVAPSPVDAFFGPMTTTTAAPAPPIMLAPPALTHTNIGGSGSFHSSPVVAVPVAAMAALSLAPPVVVASPAKKPAAPAVDTSDFEYVHRCVGSIHFGPPSN